MADMQKSGEHQAAAKRSKAKIRTVRIWLWVIALMFAGFFFLSQCAMDKPKAKAAVVDSCIKNVPLSGKWQQESARLGIGEQQQSRAVADYCVCMWDKPLDRLTDGQIKSLGSLNPQQQLDLLGGAAAFEARDRQCMAQLGGK
ncbi:hypothetical protein [Neisseria leonii]|uniref:hypothetical protein n=1 Tax=Neisseria leonii TaxID=2995413 RepID=UPI00237C3431|nr:hypothetical protein [Neisseria sp. 3986]MDD9326394.1 hypothetical protein [Neisseria sp. 3986]